MCVCMCIGIYTYKQKLRMDENYKFTFNVWLPLSGWIIIFGKV